MSPGYSERNWRGVGRNIKVPVPSETRCYTKRAKITKTQGKAEAERWEVPANMLCELTASLSWETDTRSHSHSPFIPLWKLGKYSVNNCHYPPISRGCLG